MPAVGEATPAKQTPPPTRPKRKQLQDTPPQSATSQGGSGVQAEKTLFGFHPLRSLRNIFFGYRRRPSVVATAGPCKAKSTDDLDIAKPSNASLTKQQSRKSCPFNKQMSLSAENLIDPEQLTWHPAPPDSYRPAAAAATAATAAKPKQGKVGSVSEEEDWTAEFFTDKWKIESRERVPSSSNGMHGSTEDLDAIGSICHNLDVSAARNKLAVKQKGKRMSTAFLQKGHPANARDVLGSVAESEQEEKEGKNGQSIAVSRADSSIKPSVIHTDPKDDPHSSGDAQCSPVAPSRIKRASTKSKALEKSASSVSASTISAATEVSTPETAAAAEAADLAESTDAPVSITESSAIVTPSTESSIPVTKDDTNPVINQATAMAAASIPAVLAAICSSKPSMESSGNHSASAGHRKSSAEPSGILSIAAGGSAADSTVSASSSISPAGDEDQEKRVSPGQNIPGDPSPEKSQDPNAVLHDDVTFSEENQRIYARLKKQEFSPVVKGKHRKKSPVEDGTAPGGKRPAS